MNETDKYNAAVFALKQVARIAENGDDATAWLDEIYTIATDALEELGESYAHGTERL